MKVSKAKRLKPLGHERQATEGLADEVLYAAALRELLAKMPAPVTER
jgi:hypothetical protein